MALASAVLGGGLTRARHVINAQVPKSMSAAMCRDPAGYLRNRAQELGLGEELIGMMTAATVAEFGHARFARAGLSVEAVATVGLSNALTAGDPATEYVEMVPASTVNLIVWLSATMRPACLVEAVMVATEAKARALLEIGVRSVVSGLPATGTGTDAIAVLSGDGPLLAYCGKHLLAGELIGCAVCEAILRAHRQHRSVPI